MRRPIKFRAWNTFTNTMSQALDFNTIVRETPRDNVHEGVILLQFTGLKDKSDVDIYEGDVVAIPDSYTNVVTDYGQGPKEYMNHLSEVVFEDGCFQFEIIENSDYLSRGVYTYGTIRDEIGVEGLEVIGNIYEHPELLKDNK